MRVAFHAVAGPQGGPRTYAVALAEALHARDDVELIVLTDRPQILFVPGLAHPLNSTVTVNPEIVEANGTDVSNVTVTVREWTVTMPVKMLMMTSRAERSVSMV